MNCCRTNARQTICTIVTTAIALLLVLLCAGIPSVESSTLMNGTQSGKSLTFIFTMGIITLLAMVLFWMKDKKGSFNLSIIDILLFIFISYIIIRNNLAELKYNLLFLELIGLSLFYIILRFLERKYYYWILTGLMVGGLIQAMYGNLQLWGYFPSNHGIFKMTGSFLNPGPYAGYLAAVFPVALGFYLFEVSLPVPENSSTGKYYPLRFLPLLTLIFIGLVLPASRSRAAWLAVLISSLYLISVRYQLYSKLISWFNSKVKRTFLIISLSVLLIISGAGLYFMKKGSADGRWLIWKVSVEMIKDKPLTGHGYDGFKHHYMNYQAEYFKKQPDSPEAMVAGDSSYAFNELVQLTVEYGLIGLILMAGIIYIIFLRKYAAQRAEAKHEIGSRAEDKKLGFTSAYFSNNEELFLIHLLRAMIFSIFVFSLFSYPMQVLPVKLFLATGLAVLSGIKVWETKLPNGINVQRRIVRADFFDKIAFSVGYAILICWLTLQAFKLKEAFTNWKDGYDLYNYGIYDESILAYGKAYPVLKYNGDFLTNYGKALSMAEKHSEAVEVLQQAAQYYPNTIVYTALGNSYKKLNRASNAEQAYFQAWYMNPSRFYPKYLLAKLYDETGQKEKAMTIAIELLRKDIKVESTAIEEMKKEMKKILSLEIKREPLQHPYMNREFKLQHW